MDSTQFGILGLGNMGSQIAMNLSNYAEHHGFPPVKLWNRTRGKAAQVARGVRCEIAETPEEIIENCDIVHTCLANDEVALCLFRQCFRSSGAKGTIVVDHSTLYPLTASALQKEASQAGVYYLSCPVFGPPAAAQAAGLLVVLSGDPGAKDTVKGYIVPAIAKAFMDVGLEASKGVLLKLLGNTCILGTIELLSETFTLAEKNGFDAGVLYQFIEAWFPAPAWINYGKKIRDGSFEGEMGFKIDGGMKDASFIRRMGAESSTPTPIIDQAWNHLTTAKALGGSTLDWSSCSAGMRVTAGLEPFKEQGTTPPHGSKANATKDS